MNKLSIQKFALKLLQKLHIVAPNLISSSHEAKSLNSSLVIPTILVDASPVVDLHCEDWERAKPTTGKYENCLLNTLAFQVVRVRSLIVEALLRYTVNLDDLDSEVLNSIIETGWKTSDVIEHIAKEAVDGQLSPSRLIQDLETADYLLNKFESILKTSPSHLPSCDEINALKQDLLIRKKTYET